MRHLLSLCGFLGEEEERREENRKVENRFLFLFLFFTAIGYL